jgi:hypothetical protein
MFLVFQLQSVEEFAAGSPLKISFPIYNCNSRRLLKGRLLYIAKQAYNYKAFVISVFSSEGLNFLSFVPVLRSSGIPIGLDSVSDIKSNLVTFGSTVT